MQFRQYLKRKRKRNLNWKKERNPKKKTILRSIHQLTFKSSVNITRRNKRRKIGNWQNNNVKKEPPELHIENKL
jgi:hypothetical protein